MKLTLRGCFGIFILLTTTLWLSAETELISYLRDKNWETRQNTARMLGSMREKRAVKPLIDVLEDETQPQVREAIHQALILITGQNLSPSYDEWLKWWEEKGSKEFSETTLSAREIAEARTFFNISFIVIIISLVLLLLFVMVFSFIGGSKIKAMKEIIRKVEHYLSDAEGVTKRFKTVIEEIDQRRNEAVEILKKLKEENTTEVERFADLLQQNIEHRLREETRNLREKAESELKDTVNQIRQEVEREVKRVFLEQHERFAKEFLDNKKKFLTEIDAHLTFIGGSFYFINGRYKESLRYFKKVLDIKPDYYQAWNNIGTSLRHLGRYEEALESYQRALTISPENPLVLYNIATAYSLLHRKEEMISHLKRALQLEAELKDEALNDPAFKEFWKDTAFRNIAE